MFRFFSRLWNWFWATNTILNYPLGKLIELCGNVILVEGIKLNLDNTGIPTKRKFRLLFDYEYAERRLVKRHISAELPVVELGGFIGGLACLTNKILRIPEHHIVVEANPAIIPQLERNRLANRSKFVVVAAAIAYDVEQIAITEEGMSSHITENKVNVHEEIRTITLKKIIESYNISPITLICDIEGNEITLVEREIDELRRHVQLLIMEVHPQSSGQNKVQAMLKQLIMVGFVVIDQVESVYVLHNTSMKSQEYITE